MTFATVDTFSLKNRQSRITLGSKTKLQFETWKHKHQIRVENTTYLHYFVLWALQHIIENKTQNISAITAVTEIINEIQMIDIHYTFVHTWQLETLSAGWSHTYTYSRNANLQFRIEFKFTQGFKFPPKFQLFSFLSKAELRQSE